VAVRFIAVAVALVLGSAACSFGRQSSTAPPIGDPCVVGSWVLTEETNHSGYAYAGAPVAVSGLAGATLRLSASGDEKESFDNSAPLIGTLANGVPLSITIRGSIDYRIRAASGKYEETGAVVQLPTTATAGGARVTDYHSSYAPGRGTYACAAGGLTITTEGGNQTDVWSKA